MTYEQLLNSRCVLLDPTASDDAIDRAIYAVQAIVKITDARHSQGVLEQMAETMGIDITGMDRYEAACRILADRP